MSKKLKGGARRVYRRLEAGATIRVLKRYGITVGAVLVDAGGGRLVRARHARKALREFAKDRGKV